MNPCPENKKRLSWLAAGHVGDVEARQLRGHLASCEGCRSYFAEMSGLVGNLAPAVLQEPIEASERFHQELAERVRHASRRSFGARIAGMFPASGSNGRLFWPALGAAAAIILVALTLARRPTPGSGEAIVATPLPPSLAATADSAPTLASYRNAADRSPDALDELLARQAEDGAASAASIYTTSSPLP